MQEQCLPLDHPSLFNCLHWTVDTYEKMSQTEKDLTFCRQKLDEQKSRLGENHWYIARIWIILGEVLENSDPNEALKTYEKALSILENCSSLNYVLLPVIFLFLPVHRLAFIVDIPRTDNKTPSCSNDPCIHRKCIRYSNNPDNSSFCQCERGWSGRYCNLQHTCTCASGLSCIGVSSHNRSVCICPLNQFGSRCLLTNTSCQNNNSSTCENGGQCISDTGYTISHEEFVCICQIGFSGDRCEIADKKVNVSFEKSIVFSQSMFIHFIELIKNDAPRRATTFRMILLRQNSIIVYWSQPFHLVFIELDNQNYYFANMQKIYNRSTTINKMIHPEDRCPHISELFNTTIALWPLIRRIRYYH